MNLCRLTGEKARNCHAFVMQRH